VGRIRPFAASLAALVIVGAIALSACSSSGGNTPTTPTSRSSASTDTSSSNPGGGGDITCSSGKLDGAGSTAQANAMDAWRKAYTDACSGATINYNPIGSGDGIAALTAGTVQFAGSDAALDPTDETPGVQKTCGSTPLDLPMVVGPIAIVYKLSGVRKLVLDGPTLADIFLGHVKTWNDPEIKKLNPGVTLPSSDITPFYRSDDSGTTFNFESYLSATAKSIFTTTPDKVSKGAHFAGQGKTGSQGVADAVTQTDGGIGYVELSYAAKGGLSTAEIDNGGGPVELSAATASKTAGTAKIVGKGDDLSLSIDYAVKTPGTYPIVLVTYEIVCSKYKDSSTASFVKNFLTYTINGGQRTLLQLGYAPLPSPLAAKVKKSITAIR
jgi:phosphate transport system substrate-binding protein